MSNQKTSYGAENKGSSVQQISVYTINHLTCAKNWTHICLVLVGFMAGWHTKYRWIEILKIFYRLKYLDFYFVNITVILFIVLEANFSWFQLVFLK